MGVEKQKQEPKTMFSFVLKNRKAYFSDSLLYFCFAIRYPVYEDRGEEKPRGFQP